MELLKLYQNRFLLFVVLNFFGVILILSLQVNLLFVIPEIFHHNKKSQHGERANTVQVTISF